MAGVEAFMLVCKAVQSCLSIFFLLLHHKNVLKVDVVVMMYMYFVCIVQNLRAPEDFCTYALQHSSSSRSGRGLSPVTCWSVHDFGTAKVGHRCRCVLIIPHIFDENKMRHGSNQRMSSLASALLAALQALSMTDLLLSKIPPDIAVISVVQAGGRIFRDAVITLRTRIATEKHNRA